MKLLIITQKADKNDAILGFFHRWIEEFAARYERVSVICLEKGECHLPENVKVFSLGKEEGRSRAEYLSRFYRYIWIEKGNYDAVFVHMNQEYVILGALLWKVMGKKVFLWRNHAKGNALTRIAAALSHKVFYTSSQSWTARCRNAFQMPVGIDTEFFRPDSSIERKPDSILFLGRISPVKKVLEFVEWFNALEERFTATIAGPALTRDRQYEQLVRSKANSRIRFAGAVTQEEARKLYQSHETYVNMTPAGSFDKTIIEALASGMKLRVDNPEAKNINVEEHSLKNLMKKLTKEISE